jgi:hypothetical protein
MGHHNLSKALLQSKAKSVQRKSETETEDEQSLQMKRIESLSVTPRNAVQLQRTLGNAAVQRMLTTQNQGQNVNIQREEASEEEMSLYKKSLAQITFSNLLNDPEAMMAFMPFAEKEFSTENVECLLMILRYKAASPNDRIDLLWEIQQTFLGGDAPKEVNVNKRTIEDLEKASDRQGPTDDLLNHLQQEVELTLSDTYGRISIDATQESKPFRDYVIQKAQQNRTEKRVEGRKKAMGKITSTFTKIGSALWNDGGVWGPRSKKK